MEETNMLFYNMVKENHGKRREIRLMQKFVQEKEGCYGRPE